MSNIVNNNQEQESVFKRIINFIGGDKLILLSTCEYTLGDNGRLVVAARRVF